MKRHAITLRYFYESAEKQPSPLQLMRNHQNAVKQIGGGVVYERLPKDLVPAKRMSCCRS